ncbi:hypothetical protein AtubIFM57258_003158 [Aspergillus tubingensis]|nr:hypothetical protein AtubIFM57258_003158 [Aspergillus tubingensis]
MHRLKEKISRRLHRSRHEEPAADNQSTSPDCKRSDPIEPVKELSQKRSTSASGEVLITNRDQHEEAVPRNLTEKRRSLSTSDTRREVSSVIGDDKTPDSSFPDYSKELNDDKKVPRNLWKESFDKLSQKTQDHLRGLGYEPSSDTEQGGDLDILFKDLQEKREFREKEAWKFKNDHLVRDYAATCATWVKRIGELVVPFAPSQAAGPWGLIKAALEIPVNLAAKMTALLGALERILQATYRGRLYESAYATEDGDIPDPLRRDLVNVYRAVLELFSNSINMLSGSKWAMILDAVFDKGSDLFSDLIAKEKELADTAQACSAAQGRKAIHHLQDIQGHLPRIEAQVVECLKELKAREAREILEWVSTVQYRAHHNHVRNNRTLGTGEWLLQKDAFRDWEESSSSAVLWLRGSPGVGKTFLTSKVIDHVQYNLARTSKDEGFAYFYCNRFEDIRTRPLAVAQSYVRQLSFSANETNSGKAYSKELMSEFLNIYPRTTLVLDAFDECDPASRGDLLELFEKLLSSSTRPVKLFIASRPDADVQQQVRSHPNIEVRATDNHQDIQAYISKEMPRLIGNNVAIRELRETIESTLSEKSHGMFQWTYLQLKQLERCISPEAILECLKTLPESLDKTYEGLLKEIEKKPPHDRDLALRAFKWVLAAREPLPREALLEAIRINPDSMDTRLCASISDDALLALCRNLLVIDSERDVWRVSHLSVAEYFELRKSWTSAVTNLMVGKACLLFMLSEAWNETTHKFPRCKFTWDEPPGYSCFTQTFIYYVSYFWPEHIAILDPTGVPTDDLSPAVVLLERFLGAPQESSAQYRIWAQWYDRYLSPPEYSILAVCQFGLHQVSGSWWDKGELDLSSTSYYGRTYVLLAAAYGHIQILRILLAKGGTIGIQGGHGHLSTPLIEASSNRHVEMVRYLLEDQRVDVNLEVYHGGLRTDALREAIRQRDSDMVQILVSKGAAVNMQRKNCPEGSPLAVACSYSWLEGTMFLVEQGGADVDMVLQYGDDGSALAAAATRRNCSDTLRYLVEVQRANVNLPLQAGDFGSALVAAIATWNVQNVQYLIEVGKADVNMPLPEFRYGSALARAAYNVGKVLTARYYVHWVTARKSVRLLLAAGASVILDVGNGRIVDALEALNGRSQFDGDESTRDDDEEDIFDLLDVYYDDDADGGLLANRVTASTRATLADLHNAMWQQYDNGMLSIEEAKYVEANYNRESVRRHHAEGRVWLFV